VDKTMTADDLVVPPPIPKIINYPGIVGLGAAILFTCLLLIAISKFDPTAGMLTISLLIVLSFLGVVIFCMFFTVPNDQITSGVVGGLIAAFGAVIAHWIGKETTKK
jgi:uncharacterized BrkB/YihY/UPF0761 family membrane protein